MRIVGYLFSGGKPTGYMLNLSWQDSRRFYDATGRGKALADRPIVVIVQRDRLCEVIIDCRLQVDRSPFLDDLTAMVRYFIPASFSHLWPAQPVEAMQ